MTGRLNHGSPALPGIGLPMYSNSEYSNLLQRGASQKCAWLCPDGGGVSWQFGFGTAALTSLSIEDLDGNLTSLGTSGIETVSISGSRKIHSYVELTGAPSGIWRYVIGFFGGATVYSDYFQSGGCEDNFMVLNFSDSKDYNAGAYYGGTYKNTIYIDSGFSRPAMEYTEEVVQDGLGYGLPILQRTMDIYRVDVLADAGLLATLYRAANHDTATITYPGQSDEIPINTMRASDTGAKEDDLAVVEFSFRREFMETTTQSFSI